MDPLERAARWRSLARNRRFTAEEDAKVLELAPTHSLSEIGDILGRAPSSVQSACRRMNIVTQGGPGGWPAQKRNQGVQPATEGDA